MVRPTEARAGVSTQCWTASGLRPVWCSFAVGVPLGSCANLGVQFVEEVRGASGAQVQWPLDRVAAAAGGGSVSGDHGGQCVEECEAPAARRCSGPSTACQRQQEGAGCDSGRRNTVERALRGVGLDACVVLAVAR